MLHAHFKQTLTGGLDVASTERQSKSARTGIIHAMVAGTRTTWYNETTVQGEVSLAGFEVITEGMAGRETAI